MQCPSCRTELRMSERAGVEIDYCPSCRGVWLDRGELDKILARSTSDPEDEEELPDDDRRPTGGSTPPPKRRESFWSELFDFG